MLGRFRRIARSSEIVLEAGLSFLCLTKDYPQRCPDVLSLADTTLSGTHELAYLHVLLTASTEGFSILGLAGTS